MSNAMWRPEAIGQMCLHFAQKAGQPFTRVMAHEDLGTSSVHVQLISERSAKGWRGVIPSAMRELREGDDFITKLRELYPGTFGEAVDPKEEKRAKIQLLTRKIAASGALIAQQMAHLTKLIAELE